MVDYKVSTIPGKQGELIEILSDSDEEGESAEEKSGTDEDGEKETAHSGNDGINVFVGGEEEQTERNDEEEANKGTRDDIGCALFPDAELDSETLMKLFLSGNERAEFEQTYTTAYGLCFKGELNIKKVSGSMEMGRRISRKDFWDPCFVGPEGVKRIQRAWTYEVLKLMKKREPEDSDAVVRSTRILLEDGGNVKQCDEEEFDKIQKYFKEEEK